MLVLKQSCKDFGSGLMTFRLNFYRLIFNYYIKRFVLRSGEKGIKNSNRANSSKRERNGNRGENGCRSILRPERAIDLFANHKHYEKTRKGLFSKGAHASRVHELAKRSFVFFLLFRVFCVFRVKKVKTKETMMFSV
jgi:hypothetical protein